MSVDFSVPDSVEQMGFHAHQCGVYRTDNPYTPYTDLADQLSAPTAAQAAKTLEDAWWRGWDRVASEDGVSWNAACSARAWQPRTITLRRRFVDRSVPTRRPDPRTQTALDLVGGSDG